MKRFAKKFLIKVELNVNNNKKLAQQTLLKKQQLKACCCGCQSADGIKIHFVGENHPITKEDDLESQAALWILKNQLIKDNTILFLEFLLTDNFEEHLSDQMIIQQYLKDGANEKELDILLSGQNLKRSSKIIKNVGFKALIDQAKLTHAKVQCGDSVYALEGKEEIRLNRLNWLMGSIIQNIINVQPENHMPEFLIVVGNTHLFDSNYSHEQLSLPRILKNFLDKLNIPNFISVTITDRESEDLKTKKEKHFIQESGGIQYSYAYHFKDDQDIMKTKYGYDKNENQDIILLHRINFGSCQQISSLLVSSNQQLTPISTKRNIKRVASEQCLSSKTSCPNYGYTQFFNQDNQKLSNKEKEKTQC